MESRLAAKIEQTSEATREASALAKQTHEALKDLELKVEATEVGIREVLKEALKESEDKIMATVQATVKNMVEDQLRSAGFDQDLSAGDLTVRSSVASTYPQQSKSYAEMTRTSGTTMPMNHHKTKEERQEDKFWLARRSLRMWPVNSFDRAGIEAFLSDKLKMNKEFISDELGEIVVSRVKDLKKKTKSEALVLFESKQIIDAIKAKAHNRHSER